MRAGTGLCVIIISAFIIFLNLGTLPLLDPDEPVYAETPKEMLQYNEFLSPRIYGEYWYDKPPLYYWLVAGTFNLLGIHELAARLPSAVMAVACVAMVYAVNRRRFGELAGIFGALILTTSLEFFYLGKAAVTDMTLTLCLTVSLVSYMEKRYYLIYLFAALATLTKGPVGLLFPVAIIFLHMFITRNFSEIKHMHIWTGSLLYCGIAVPWYWFMYVMHGPVFIDTFLGFHNIMRFTSPEHPEGILWYYYLPVLIVGFFPWISVLPQAVLAACKANRREPRTLSFLLTWAVFIFAFFSISQTKLVSYILPMFPPVAMIVGWYVARIACAYRQRGWLVSLLLYSILLLVAIWMGTESVPVAESSVMLLSGCLTAMVIPAMYFIWRRQIHCAVVVQLSGMAILLILLMHSIIPQIAPVFSSKEIAGDFASYYDGVSPVYIIKILRPGFAFYSGVNGIELDKNDLERNIAESAGAYFVVRQMDYQKLTTSGRQKIKVLAAKGDRMLLFKP
ncbi:putative membrane protein [Propionispora sp. 2/2-37]|uniref:ArnT family glycosyltransferase n=1 Tax=Propionispora sp. 2/2-37 TaxID=1677858 RepID=UPI0006BB981C|nr:glycosyltransferase family 39 protein [Propionispora sp. 2/2-37]CUH94000.1 putative membrane protein [Propionispora sp. 2/2-37]